MPTHPRKQRNILYYLLLGGIFFLGDLLRLWYPVQSQFPLNDGGMFYAMVEDLKANHFILPKFSTYNFSRIPFVYPPLAFYVAGALNALGIPLIDIFRILPAIAATLCIIPVFLCLRLFKVSRTATVLALFMYAVAPEGIIWKIMGGGLTRSLGQLFSFVAVYLLLNIYMKQQWSLRTGIITVLVCLAAILTHLESALFVGVTWLVLICTFGTRAGLRYRILVLLGLFIYTIPWIATILSTHGFSPITNAFLSGYPSKKLAMTWHFVFDYLSRQISAGSYDASVPFIAPLLFLGILAAGLANKFFVFWWWILQLLADPRGGIPYSLLPRSIIIGIAIDYIRALTSPDLDHVRLRYVKIFAAAVVSVIVIFSAVNILTARRPPFEFRTVSMSDKNAMDWIAANTPTKARFVVLENVPWEIASVSEWFPVWARRKSVATPQGTEWLDNRFFFSKIEQYRSLLGCFGNDFQCLARWSETEGNYFDYLYVSTKTAGIPFAFLSRLQKEPQLQEVYNQNGVVIYAKHLENSLK